MAEPDGSAAQDTREDRSIIPTRSAPASIGTAAASACSITEPVGRRGRPADRARPNSVGGDSAVHAAGAEGGAATDFRRSGDAPDSALRPLRAKIDRKASRRAVERGGGCVGGSTRSSA